MNANRSSEPRFNIVIWKGAKQLGTLRDRDASRALSNFGGVVARYKTSTDNHRVELYDGENLIEAWSSDDGNKAASAEAPVPASGKIHREGERVRRAIPCQLVPSRSAKA
jgi:1,6-anhydro-N-acetylmuramate kinase